MNWESPVTITQEISSRIARDTDDYIMSEIYKTGVTVNKEELIKAINYDRDQYKKVIVTDSEMLLKLNVL